MSSQCKTIHKLIQPYVDQRISDRDCARLLVHIEQCSSCYNELETAYLIHYALEYMDRDESGAIDIKTLMQESIIRHKKTLKFHQILRIIGSVLGILILAVVIIITISLLLPNALPRVNEGVHDAADLVIQRLRK